MKRHPVPVPAPRPGFTLLELLVVFAILAFATALAVPAFRSLLKQDDMTAATHRIEALFRLARDSAIRGGEPVTVVMDSVSGAIWLEVPSVSDPFAEPGSGAAPTRMSLRVPSAARMFAEDVEPGEDLELPAAIRVALGRARARFTFAPTGAAFADSLVLRSSLGERHVTLNRWTGDVVVR